MLPARLGLIRNLIMISSPTFLGPMIFFFSVCRHVGGNGGPELLKAVPPQVVCAVLTSPQLVGKKNVGNVTELFQLLQVSP